MTPFTVPVPNPSRAAPSAPSGKAIAYGGPTATERTSTVKMTGATAPDRSTGISATAWNAAISPARRSETARRPTRATARLDAMKIVEAIENHAPISPDESPWSPS